MNIPSILNNLHSFYGKAKYAFLAVFVLTVMFSAFISSRAYGDSVVGTVETRIALQIDGKTRNILSTQNTVAGALAQNGIYLDKYDITDPALDTYLSGASIDVSVIRAVPVLVTDNGQSWPATSAYTSPTDILKQLAVEIFPEDIVTAELILDPVAEGSVGQKVMIKRAPVYNIYVDDLSKVVRSWVKTVGDLLTEKGITLGPNDIVEPTKDTPLAGVIEIVVTRINFADIEEVVSIPYQSIEQKDYNMYQGKTAVTQNGLNGSKKQNVHIVYKNGVELERTVTASVVVESPQNKITAVGVKPYSHEDLWNIMVSASAKYGNKVSPLDLYKVANCESHFNAGSIGYDRGIAKYYGLFQYNLGLWQTASSDAGFAGASWTDPTAQIYATARYASLKGWGAWGCKP